MITTENWTYSHYANNNLKAIISFGASPTDSGICEEYFATVIDEEGKDIFQKQFQELKNACDYINGRYQEIWDFVDATNLTSSKEGGCATCVAH